ncbi:hypothetical protein C0J52_13318 [Blattella germanica]|nr:hypothetical protein C0J52_13318 [Blattella germanica]
MDKEYIDIDDTANIFTNQLEQLAQSTNFGYDNQEIEVTENGKQWYKCARCGRSYLHRRSLWRHSRQECRPEEPRFQPIEVIENGKLYFKCSRCEKKYSHRKNLMRHTNLECGQEPRFLCPYCPFRSKHKYNAETHIKMRHFK